MRKFKKKYIFLSTDILAIIFSKKLIKLSNNMLEVLLFIFYIVLLLYSTFSRKD